LSRYTSPALAFVLGFLLMWVAWPHLARGQEHSHPREDAELHDKFYSTWMRPNGGRERTSSCCNKSDCYPAKVRRRGDQWEFQRREDRAWIPIPDDLIEQNQADPRESPDERSHVCAPSPYIAYSVKVFCFTFGAGL
jgi:hypothetical protein